MGRSELNVEVNVLGRVFVIVTSDLLVEDLVTLVDVCDWLITIILLLSLLLAHTRCCISITIAPG